MGANGRRGKLRIIGGAWRGRRLVIPDLPGLRPTPDRVRETLFNWLAPVIEGAHCLDLFAGSGALGLEAASRGAARTLLVEQASAAVKLLREHVKTLDAKAVEVIQADAIGWLNGSGKPFDIIFLDPPFDANLYPTVLPLLAAKGWLKPQALIYIESPAQGETPQLPAGYRIIRGKQAGQVRYNLASNQPE